jgi:GH35 family endo-1,4-beta-xylanase/TPP-dependent 2-oxoacid decarboxylase
MKKLFYKLMYLVIAICVISVSTLSAQNITQNFEGYTIGDSVSIGHVSYAPGDIKTVIATDPLVSGNQVLKVTTTNYGAGPVIMFVLPAGKTLADYDSLTFNAYYTAGDLSFKLIYAEGFQTKPTTHSLNDSDTLYSYNRTLGASTAWERISLAAKKTSAFHDTVYIAFGTNNSGATWYADNVTLIAKAAAPIPLGISQNFEGFNIGDSVSIGHISYAPADIKTVITADPLASGNKVLKVTTTNYGAGPVLAFVLPAGKTLADYDSLTFNAYYTAGDLAFKLIAAEAYQTFPTGHHLFDADTNYSFNRTSGASTGWERISLTAKKISTFHDTVYIAIGTNNSGATWYLDNVALVAKAVISHPLGLSQNFESYTLDDSVSIAHISYAPADIKTVIAADPLVSGNKVLKVTTTNYGAGPVLAFVLPAGKTLADYDSLTFNAYYTAGDLAFKLIAAEAYQTFPTGHHLFDADTNYSFNRTSGASTGWERISLAAKKISTFHDTVYIAIGTNNSGATWYLDNVALVAKAVTIVTNGSFESSNVADSVNNTDVKGWLIQTAAAVTPAPVYSIVSDTVEDGHRALKVLVNATGANPWDIQAVADSLQVKPGGVYNYSVWLKASKAGAQVSLTIGNYAFTEYKALRPVNLTTSWTQYTTQFTVNDNNTVIRGPIHFSYTGNVGNAIFVDNLQITENKPDTTAGTVYKGPAFAKGQSKFIGSALSGSDANFINYWNQVTPENAGKFGSVAASADSSTWNWAPLDAIYNFAVTNNIIFKDHNLVWGNQQPAWITAAGYDTAHQRASIEQWIRMVGARYPKMSMIDVVNEPLPGHAPAPYAPALGGAGATGWDWIIWTFQKARQYMPANTKLILNDYNILNSTTNTAAMLKIVNLLKDRNLIDGIGIQGHRFELENTDTAMIRTNLNTLAASGIPIYITEFDLGNYNDSGTPNDSTQLALYKKIFPVLWKHPGIKGITFWDYIQGAIWQTTAYLVRSDGTARPVVQWLADFIKANPVTGVKEISSQIPVSYELKQNFPNPFNPTTNIQYNIPKTSNVTLRIYDVLGRLVQTLVNTEQKPGSYSVSFNAQNLSSGVYFYQINAGNFTETKKLMLLK